MFLRQGVCKGEYICFHWYSMPPYKRWGSVAELTCHLQDSTTCGIRCSHKTNRPSPTKDVNQKDPPFIRGPLVGGCTVWGSKISGWNFYISPLRYPESKFYSSGVGAEVLILVTGRRGYLVLKVLSGDRPSSLLSDMNR
jgi:hypothetical protein